MDQQKKKKEYHQDYDTLQMAIDSGQWKTDPQYFQWTWEEFSKLIDAGFKPPPNFGSLR